MLESLTNPVNQTSLAQAKNKLTTIVGRGIPVLALVLWACSPYGTWTADYCRGEPCDADSSIISHTDVRKHEEEVCPPSVEVKTGVYVEINGYKIEETRTDYLKSGTCVIVVPTRTPTESAPASP